LGLISIVF